MSNTTQLPLPAFANLIERLDRSARRHHERLPMLALVHIGRIYLQRWRDHNKRQGQLLLELEYTKPGSDRYKEIIEELKAGFMPAVLVLLVVYASVTFGMSPRGFRASRGSRRQETYLVEAEA